MKTSTVIGAIFSWFLAAGMVMGSAVIGWVYVATACLSSIFLLFCIYGLLGEGKKLAPILYYQMAKDKAATTLTIIGCLVMAAAVAINGSLSVIVAYVANWTAFIFMLLALRHSYKSTLTRYTRPDTYSEE